MATNARKRFLQYFLAALLPGSGTASGAVPDAQEQAIAMLSGVSASPIHYVVECRQGSGSTGTPHDHQFLAQWLLAGRPRVRDADEQVTQMTIATPVASMQDRGADAGVSAIARRLLAGKGS